MATQLIATGTGATNSNDITVTDTPVTVSLKGASASGCLVGIYLKNDAGGYEKIGELREGADRKSKVLSGPGVYRLSRDQFSSSCGAFSA